jgi:hypothetical protein
VLDCIRQLELGVLAGAVLLGVEDGEVLADDLGCLVTLRALRTPVPTTLSTKSRNATFVVVPDVASGSYMHL